MKNSSDSKDTLKYKYDSLLKKDYIGESKDKEQSFGYVIIKKFDNYFNNDKIDYFIKELDKSGHLKAYENGKGQELILKYPNPPKFLSIGSSSNFSYFSLRNHGFKYFAKEIEKNNINIIEDISFEKD